MRRNADFRHWRRLSIHSTDPLKRRGRPRADSARTAFALEMGYPEMHSDSKAALAFTYPSRHAGPAHIVRVDTDSLRPLSCTCEAGRHGKLCWAVIRVAAAELEALADRRWRAACGEVDIRHAADVVVQVRKWARAARELESLRSCGYVVVKAQPADVVA
jgi:hypothetical protein